MSDYNVYAGIKQEIIIELFISFDEYPYNLPFYSIAG